MKKKQKKRDYLPFMNLENMTMDDIPKCNGEMMRLCFEVNLSTTDMGFEMDGIKAKTYDCVVEYTFGKGNLCKKKETAILNRFEDELMKILSPVMDFIDEIKIEVNKE